MLLLLPALTASVPALTAAAAAAADACCMLHAADAADACCMPLLPVLTASVL
jgi:hypothetical protein